MDGPPIFQAIQEYLALVEVRSELNEDLDLKSLLGKLKHQAVKRNDQEQAKQIWCYEQVLTIQTTYIGAFQALKEQEYYGAWCLLEQVEVALHHLERHFRPDGNDYKLWFIDKHIRQLQSLFPYKLFSSPGYIRKKVLCTICGQQTSIRSFCGHTVGEIYNGELCGREIVEAELVEISLTPSPAHKYAVTFLVDSETNEQVDHYDYSLVEYVIAGLRSPFDGWDIEWTKIRHPHSKFANVAPTDDCPCDSGRLYKNCCLIEDGVLRPHVNLRFWKDPPPELPSFRYNY